MNQPPLANAELAVMDLLWTSDRPSGLSVAGEIVVVGIGVPFHCRARLGIMERQRGS